MHFDLRLSLHRRFFFVSRYHSTSPNSLLSCCHCFASTYFLERAGRAEQVTFLPHWSVFFFEVIKTLIFDKIRAAGVWCAADAGSCARTMAFPRRRAHFPSKDNVTWGHSTSLRTAFQAFRSVRILAERYRYTFASTKRCFIDLWQI